MDLRFIHLGVHLDTPPQEQVNADGHRRTQRCASSRSVAAEGTVPQGLGAARARVQLHNIHTHARARVQWLVWDLLR